MFNLKSYYNNYLKDKYTIGVFDIIGKERIPSDEEFYALYDIPDKFHTFPSKDYNKKLLEDIARHQERSKTNIEKIRESFNLSMSFDEYLELNNLV